MKQMMIEASISKDTLRLLICFFRNKTVPYITPAYLLLLELGTVFIYIIPVVNHDISRYTTLRRQRFSSVFLKAV
ncbi:CPA_1a_G0010600.mRNA.1.CDS.1 [Saccharomyces cerevisiae]|nr:CPA_1a_G0010600.mRNA.1.CDS.1 [Saccharomyces cerevisiae]CAI7206929.1 CPA_1a_G0010600.mRNA.1.CDS.1 [Saccharomyces cerevisiae]